MDFPAHIKTSEWATALPVPQDDEDRPGKRSRVAIACRRCKSRKQKCNGTNPCSKCKPLNVSCEYDIPQKRMPFGKNQYIRSLEIRVAELETFLAKQGMSKLSADHWNMPKSDAETQHTEDQQSAIGRSDSQPLTPDIDGWDDDSEWQHGAGNVVSIVRSLSLDVNGANYIGASSHVIMGKLFSLLGQRRMGSTNPSPRTGRQQIMLLDKAEPQSVVEPIDFHHVPSDMADHLLKAYIKHISTRFPVLHSVWVRDVHERRLTLTSVLEATLLHLAYATGGRFLETTGEFGAFYPKRHWAAALQNLDTILNSEDIKSVSALLLMAVYCLRDPIGPGAWTYSRLAMVLALDLGLHRKTGAMKRVSLENEMRKRVFWAVYSFDRQISIPLGRPFAIGDRDIDVPLPLEMDESTTGEQLVHLQNLNQEQAEKPSGPRDISTSLSSFIHVARMRRIESEIQQTVYRVDEIPDISDILVEQFLQKLDAWKDMIPLDAYKTKDKDGVPFDGHNLYMIYYCKSKRLLLYPKISNDPVNPRYLKECAITCAGVCGNYKRLHQSLDVGYSVLSLQTVFMAGLTLVYCIWISPEEIFDITTSTGIHDCSIVLFVIADRVPITKKYRNAFEVIRQRVIDQISDGSSRKPKETVSGLASDLGPAVDLFEINRPFEVDHDSFEQFSQIILEMSGEESSFSNAFVSGLDVDMPSMPPPPPGENQAITAPTLVGRTYGVPATLDYRPEGAVDSGYNESLSPWFSGAPSGDGNAGSN